MVLCAAEATTKGYCIIQLGTGCAVSSPAGADHNPVVVPGAKPLKAPRILHLMVPTSGKKAPWFPVYCVQDHRKIHPVQKTVKRRQILFTEEKVQKISTLFLHSWVPVLLKNFTPFC